ncbi:uncharacterized protein [Centroberyx affinis]|uniref:uncharacterized protein n=1 Tax=Centroberyx affinis TaxID=166261 RepID=UPI003A5B99A4
MHKRMDVESLQNVGRRRGRCMDVFLVMSIIFLFVAVAAVAAGGVMVVIELRSKIEVMRPSFGHDTPAKQTGDTSAPAYKMQNFASLDANTSKLKNSTMQWAAVEYGEGNSVGSHFDFDSRHHSLKPKKEGHYFMYLDLVLTCTSYQCKAGVLTVSLGDKLTCSVQLPEEAESPVSRKCWTVERMDGQTPLVAQMTVPQGGLENWKLELKGSKLGMFLVD